MRYQLLNVLYYVLIPLCAARWFFFFASNKAARRIPPHIFCDTFRPLTRAKIIDKAEQIISFTFGVISLCLALLMLVILLFDRLGWLR
jgi:hypothetical protein